MSGISMQALYRPYECLGGMLDDTIAWIHTIGKKLDISPIVVEAAINETFLEMAEGLTFSVTGEGTPSKRPNAAMNYYLRKKLFQLADKYRKEYRLMMEESLNHKFKMYNMNKRKNFFNWNKSPVARIFKRGS